MTELNPNLPRRRGVTGRPALLASALMLAILMPPKLSIAGSDHALMVTVQRPALVPEGGSEPLRVTVEPAIDDAALIPEWVRVRNSKVAEKMPSADGHEQWIAVEIGGATYDYRVSVVAMRDGVPVGTVAEPEVCECNSEKLLEMVDARIEAVTAELQATSAEVDASDESNEGDPSTEGESGQTDPGSNDRDGNDHPSRLGTMGYVGIGVGVLGVGALAAGISLALRQDELHGSGELKTLSSYSTRPPGIAFAAGGSVALAAGVALFVVDFLRHHKSSVAVVPTFGPRHAGLSISRKF